MGLVAEPAAGLVLGGRDVTADQAPRRDERPAHRAPQEARSPRPATSKARNVLTDSTTITLRDGRDRAELDRALRELRRRLSKAGVTAYFKKLRLGPKTSVLKKAKQLRARRRDLRTAQRVARWEAINTPDYR
jgi:ribosomal protein S21